MVITGRNEVVVKVIFLHLSVIHSVHRGVCLSACWDTTPLGSDTPPKPGRPTRPGRPPWTRQTSPGPGRPPQIRHPPGPGRPPRKQTPAHGLRAAGTHPTGMHSCFECRNTFYYKNGSAGNCSVRSSSYLNIF